MPRHLLIAAALATAAAALPASDEDWRQVSDFAASGVFAGGDTVIAWDVLRYAISTDGGVSWSNPIAPVTQGQAPDPIRACAVSESGTWILTATGKVLRTAVTAATAVPGPAFANLAVDGGGRLYAEGIDGSIDLFTGTAVPLTAHGRLYRAVKDGVLVQAGSGGLTLQTPTGASGVKFVGERLPPVMDLAPLTTRGGDRWATTRATTWLLRDGKVSAFGERQAQVSSYGFGDDGYHELLQWTGPSITFLQGGTGLAGHPRTRHIPQDAKLLTVTSRDFVVVTGTGIWYVPIAL